MKEIQKDIVGSPGLFNLQSLPLSKGEYAKLMAPTSGNRLETLSKGETNSPLKLDGTRTVIPKKLRSKLLDELNKGHPGITRMKEISHSSIRKLLYVHRLIILTIYIHHNTCTVLASQHTYNELLNMAGHSYGGRKLLLTQSCCCTSV